MYRMNRHRPRYPKTDENHNLVPMFCNSIGYRWGGMLLKPMDTSKLGGEFLDWILHIGPLPVHIEVKTEEEYRKYDKGMTEGEKTFFCNHKEIPKAVVANYEHMAGVMAQWGPVAHRLLAVMEEAYIV